ncbi:hypothetical protein B0J11DRAFT_330151 [Dendryphion nanum]|uniref:Glycoprotease family protein n=1 Tax=Dendryphion nanum TaxID=256645 RepID=A0A9P9DRJ1_9PLEO|nr:hypothetical protein B0J11DRAFT_330151 [Dendryphion nanum]
MSTTYRREPELNGTYTLPTTTYETSQWQSDAQIAARKAMAKRNSRSYSAKATRTKSKKREMLARPMKPTVDTSFTTHRGNVPRQIHPHDNDLKSSGTFRKHNFLGLSRSNTKTKGLGIMKGTPQPDDQEQLDQSGQEPKTAGSLGAVNPLWTGISPSDRPIPIGISIPTDSLPDFSPYQSTRHRSTSDAVTPSIIITPAAAFQSVWSPDTESEYTPSVYSRATLNYVPLNSVIPPVPALPADIFKSTVEKEKSERHEQNKQVATRARHDTLDSAGTAFEEYDYEIKRSDRIMSSATVFEEDELPLRSQGMQAGGLTIDTTGAVPNPRRSEGWWNYITTPFEFSRANSVWTQNARNAERTPGIPMIPRRFDKLEDSPSTPSTYIWSATEKSPSVAGDIPIIAMSFDTKDNKGDFKESGTSKQVSTVSTKAATSSDMGVHEKPRNEVSEPITSARDVEQQEIKRSQSKGRKSIVSPLSAMSASPILGTAAIGTVLVPRQIHEQQQQINVNVNIELQDRRPAANAPMGNDNQSANTSTANATTATRSADTSSQPPVLLHGGIPVAITHNAPQFPPPPQQPLQPLQTSTFGSQGPQVDSFIARNAPSQGSPPQFPPPPHFAHYNSTQKGYDFNSRSSSPVSDGDLKKSHKKPRKVFALMDRLRFGRRSHKAKKHDKTKKRRRMWCWGCCCCLLLLILLAIILPIVIVFSRKQNNDPKGRGNEQQQPPPQWLNFTGYPPVPTGVSAVFQPNPVSEQTGCVAPATVWSCAIPKEQQKLDSGVKPNQPNMTFEITFQNGTSIDPSKLQPARRSANAVMAGAFIRSLLQRDIPSPTPAPPELEDYKFLGNTTDRIQAPFEGEVTPFFISLQAPQSKITSGLAKRADENLTNITQSIPNPSLNSDGTAAPANLLPTASNQPLRLFNRGKEDEHYGFFVYYDRSIFLKNTERNFSSGGNPADLDGGSPFSAATMRVTWAQTRFLVQIWTRSEKSKQLLRPSDATADKTKGLAGFAYPITVTIDRHGSRANKKMLYFYKMEKDGTIINNTKNKNFIFEDRKFGGTAVNPARGVDQDVKGPVDGGLEAVLANGRTGPEKPAIFDFL